MIKLTELRRSTSRKGGWLVNGKPQREAHAIFKRLPSTHCHVIARSDAWWLDDAALDLLESQCENWATFCASVGYTPRKQEPPPRPITEHASPYAAMYLRDNAPDEVVDAVFRALAKMVHPDIAKDNGERMKRLNSAYEAIKSDRQKQA